jgi:hypothetical protein
MANQFKEPKIIPSKGSSGAVRSYKENLLIPEGVVFPTAELTSKLTKSGHGSDFADENRRELEADLGYYCDLQSIKSEDAITWSLFGYVGCQSQDIRDRFFNELLSALHNETDTNCQIKLWQRLPHPNTSPGGGPEMDVILMGEKYMFLVECKWGSAIDKKQGVDKDKSQIDIRKEWIQKFGKTEYPNHRIKILLVANENLVQDDKEVLFISWEDFCKFSLPHKELFTSYFEWKKQLLN